MLHFRLILHKFLIFFLAQLFCQLLLTDKLHFTNFKVDWGSLYNTYKNKKLDPDAVEKEVAKLVMDDDVTSKPGIYPYIFDRDEKHLNIRVFTDAMKQKVYEKQSGVCAVCGEKFELDEMEADHIKPWSEGGRTDEDNCQMLCQKDNRRKSSK